ncbi:putative reverse transcriptase domain-containing protein [Tanacetum coccineum]
MIAQRVAGAIAAYEANQNNQNGNGNPNVNAGGDVPVARECTYQDFMKCQPLNFNRTEGVVALTRWFEKMEIVFNISNFPYKYQALMKLMTEVYCPRNEIQKKETELWNLAMVPEEEDQVEKFIRDLPNNIQGNMIVAEPTRLQDAIRIANNSMNQKLKGYAENKRRNKNKKGYAGILPLYNKCKLHHHRPCPVKCGNCKKVSHQARDCWASTTVTCYERGGKGHTKKYCPELGNQNGDGEARQNLDIVMSTSFLKNLLHSRLN